MYMCASTGVYWWRGKVVNFVIHTVHYLYSIF